ncbi:hypothetical protein LCGC14_3031360 [marine sediment metagenome]|uniref:Uncharacterized protein n=1 Tax=marine sediment metagenome TaxID=412755 RepID=A0A0F8Z065_9ZZZZ
MKTKEEVLLKATNEHDRELMRKSLDKFDKVYKVSQIMLSIAVVLGVIGIGGIYFINAYFIIALLPSPFLLIFAQLNLFRSISI